MTDRPGIDTVYQKNRALLEEIERLRAEVDRLERALNGAVKKLTRLEAARAARVSKSSSITGGGKR